MQSAKRRLLPLAFAAFSCLAVLMTPPTHAAVSFRTVVMTGDTAPGVAPEMTFSRFWLYRGPMINEAGLTAFRVDINEFGFPFGGGDNSIWREENGSFLPVVLPSTPAPGTEQGTMLSQGALPIINSRSDMAFLASLSGPDVTALNRFAIYSGGGSGPLDLVARENDPAPGTEQGTIYDSLSLPVFNEAGQTAFKSSLNGTGTLGFPDQGIWLHSAGSTELVVRHGDNAPGEPGGLVFLGFEPPTLNDNGQLAFLAAVSDTDQGNELKESIWSGTPGNMNLIAIEGAQAPDTGAGVIFEGVPPEPALNNAGQTAFIFGLSGPGVDGTNNSGIWLADSQNTELVARKGQAAPGTEPQTVFSDFTRLLLNGQGHTLFEASITGPNIDGTNNLGIWHKDTDALRLIAQKGSHAPGTGPGVVFQTFYGRHSPPGFLINNQGQIVFQGTLTGTDVDSSNNTGVWASDRNGNIQLIVRAGDLFDVNDDPLIEDLRTVLFARLMGGSGGEDGRPTSFNNAGQLAIDIEFTDGYGGIFVASVGIPGDLDGDGFVGINDLNIVLSNWNQNVPPADPLADLSGDGFVGIDDLNAVLSNWNAGTPPAIHANIPEPGTMAALGLTGLALTHRHRRT